jgi:hypothetical protein
MFFRKKRMVLLSSVAILLLFTILDISIHKEEVFENFSKQFVNVQKTEEYIHTQQEVIAVSERKLEVNREGIKEIFLSSVRGKGNLTVSSSYGSLLLSEITGNIDMTNRYSQENIDTVEGNIVLDSQFGHNLMVNIKGQITGDAEHGATTIIMQESDGYRLDAAVVGGRIHTVLPLSIKQEKDGDYRTHLTGVVGDGTWNVEVKARSGDIIFHVK